MAFAWAFVCWGGLIGANMMHAFWELDNLFLGSASTFWELCLAAPASG